MATNTNLALGLQDFMADFRAMWADMASTPNAGAYAKWTQDIDANGSTSVTWAFIANHPKVRKWIGARIAKNPRLYTQSLGYDDYEATMELPMDLVNYDKTGAVKDAIKTFLEQTDMFDSVVTTALDSASGAGPTGFDGAALVSASHPHSSSGGNQSNIASGTNLSAAALAAADGAGMLITYENGEPAGIRYNTLRVGPLLKHRSLEITGSTRLVAVANDGLEAGTRVAAAAIPSTFTGGALDVIVDDRITTRYWDLVDTRRSAKPIVLFRVQNPEPVIVDDPASPIVYENKRYSFGVTAKLGAAAGHWHTIFRGTGTA